MNAAIAPGTIDFDGLFREYHKRVYTYMRQHTLRPGDSDETAQDLAMKVFLRAMEAVERGNGPHTHSAGWLFTIARNLLYDYYRRCSHVPATIHLDAIAYDDDDDSNSIRTKGEIIVAEDKTPHDIAERNLTCQRVQYAIDRLTGEQPTVIRGRMAGYEYGEIAAEIGKSEGAAKQLSTRAYAQMRKYMEDDEWTYS